MFELLMHEQALDKSGYGDVGINADLAHEALRVVRYTRNWIHYGLMFFILLCSLVAALRGAVTP